MKSTKKVPTEQFQKILVLINRSRTINGKEPLTAKAAEEDVALWYAEFERNIVPPDRYNQLMDLALDVRADFLANGKTPPWLTVELLISQWVGRTGLRARIALQGIGRGVCVKCNGTGFEQVVRYGYSGVIDCLCRPKRSVAREQAIRHEDPSLPIGNE